MSLVSFYAPWKHRKRIFLCFSDIFRGFRKRSVACHRLDPNFIETVKSSLEIGFWKLWLFEFVILNNIIIEEWLQGIHWIFCQMGSFSSHRPSANFISNAAHYIRKEIFECKLGIHCFYYKLGMLMVTICMKLRGCLRIVAKVRFWY